MLSARLWCSAGLATAMVRSSGLLPAVPHAGGVLPLASGRFPHGRVLGSASPRLRATLCSGASEGSIALPVTVEGEGPETLFFVHGWPDDEHLWDAQVAHLRGQYRCIRATFPHFAGRRQAEALGHKPEGYDYVENAAILAATIRAACPDEAVTLVLHDWGCVWGFLAMAELRGLVKAVVAMDVGPLSAFLSGSLSRFAVIGMGLGYQYWLMMAYLFNRTDSALGRQIADRMVKLFLSLIWRNPNKKAELEGDRITAAACYPYFYFQTGWGVRGAGPPPGPGELEPPCPCLFLYGRKKPVKFHSPAWETHLKTRPDCKVVALNCGHWLQVERPAEVNAAMESWLAQTLQSKASDAAPRSRL